MGRFIFAPPVEDVRAMIQAAIGEHRRRPQMRLSGREGDERNKYLTCTCGPCRHSLGHRKEQQVCFCGAFGAQVSSTLLRFCMLFEPKY